MRSRFHRLLLTLVCIGLPACGQAQGDARAGEAAPAPAAASEAESDAERASTAWRLAAGDSRISFVSIKAGDAAENHYFRDIEGAVDAGGAARISINLDSVETNVDIRNERMRKVLFETGEHPTATVSTQIDLGELAALDDGERRPQTVDLPLDVHGVEAQVPATVFVSRLGPDRVSVETVEPVLILADDFGLAAGIEQLREIAGLPAISAAVPVTASLVFER